MVVPLDHGPPDPHCMRALLTRPPFSPHRVRMDGCDGLELRGAARRGWEVFECEGTGKVIEGQKRGREGRICWRFREGYAWFDSGRIVSFPSLKLGSLSLVRSPSICAGCRSCLHRRNVSFRTDPRVSFSILFFACYILTKSLHNRQAKRQKKGLIKPGGQLLLPFHPTWHPAPASSTPPKPQNPTSRTRIASPLTVQCPPRRHPPQSASTAVQPRVYVSTVGAAGAQFGEFAREREAEAAALDGE